MSTQEINNLINANIELVDEMRILKKENKELNKKIEQALEFINEHLANERLPRDYEYKLREILKGGDF